MVTSVNPSTNRATIMIVPMNEIHDENLDFSVGAEIIFAFRGKNVNIFDKETERNLEF